MDCPVVNHDTIIQEIFSHPLARREFVQKVEIKKKGRPTPDVQIFQKDGNKSRSFSMSAYRNCEWLTACVAVKRLFCWPCILFPAQGISNEVWQSSGFVDLKNLPRAIVRHTASKEHIIATVKLVCLGTQRIDHAIDEGAKLLTERHNEQVSHNRDILKRLIDITSLLARQELAFRGHDESADSQNKGNYREVFAVLSKYDNLVKNLPAQSNVFTGLSKTIQNDLVEAISQEIRLKICDEVSQTHFFAWQIDETTDISCKSQLSLIVRYVQDGKVVERFMGFFDVSAGRCATDLKALVDREMTRFNYAEKLIAQTYDGAAVMASELNGLQSKVKGDAPQALFIHCYAHQLNLVLSKSVKDIRQARIFFSHLSGFASFFSKSTKRSHVLDSVQARRLPTNAPTRWNFASRPVSVVAHSRDKLIETFETICDSKDFDEETVRQADGFLDKLHDFDFMFLLYTFRSVFAITDVLYDVLQSKSTDVGFCQRRIASAIATMKELRKDDAFDKVYADVWDILPAPAEPRRTCRNAIRCSDRNHGRALYFEIFDLIIGQLELRFSDFDKLLFLSLMDISNFPSYAKEFPEMAFQNLVSTYGRYFDTMRLKNELLVLYSDIDLVGSATTSSSLLLMFTEQSLETAMPEVTKLMKLVVTIPATSASTERSFSCLKRIKNCARNTMNQERLTSLSLISIEKKLVKEMEKMPTWYGNVTDRFADMKDRRLDFIFK